MNFSGDSFIKQTATELRHVSDAERTLGWLPVMEGEMHTLFLFMRNKDRRNRYVAINDGRHHNYNKCVMLKIEETDIYHPHLCGEDNLSER